ncbi:MULTISPECIES: hypothetical protein [Micrococcaceae]|uniref:hypothetical protein n=1 Tax=Micrococcaceae TaxID=1268 RepID=UPI001609AB01|nr:MULTISPECIES: hypothetical protein [Micrococcaceae]MBB5749812.1 Kef-type K+ transport system membrane component KefB [Micrococcus sp. TA1]HRO92663.1 hypothetical protein [Citricoccus sp.]
MSTPSRGPDDDDFSYGRLYGRAPRTGGAGASTLSTVYTFVLVWMTTALIMWFGSRLFGFERGDVTVAVVSLACSLAAAIAITAWVRRRRR